MMSLSTAALSLAISAAPAVPVSPAAVPADCLTLPAGVFIAPGKALHTSEGPAIALAGKSVCDTAGNRAVLGVDATFGPITSYLAPPPISAVPAVAAVAGEATGETGDIAGIIAGTSIFGGFLTLFAGGVFLAVRHSYRVNPDPSVTWAGPPLMLAPAGPSVREQLEGMYSASPGMYPQTPYPTAPDRPSDYSSDRQTDRLSDRSRPSDHGPVQPKPGPWDDWGEPTEPELFDLSGWSLRDFKDQLSEGPGTCQVESLNHPTQKEAVARRVFEYVKEYGSVRIDCALWEVFGLTDKGGSGPYAQRCQLAKDFIKAQFAKTDPRDIF
jgi:hypothetical protein